MIFLLKKDIKHLEAIDYFTNIELFNPAKNILANVKEYQRLDHHKCHAYYALYGGKLKKHQLNDTLVLTADAMETPGIGRFLLLMKTEV